MDRPERPRDLRVQEPREQRSGLMRYRVTAAVAVFGAAALLLAWWSTSGPDASAQSAMASSRPERVAGRPNLNGVWQAMNTANWNLEAHSAAVPPHLLQFGAMLSIPPGESVIEGGTIPYRPEALKKRQENQASWPQSDPEAKCFMGGVPRATYMPYPFQIVQGENDDLLMTYQFAGATRIIQMDNHQEAPVDSWMGWSNGRWDGDTLVVEVTGLNDQTWFDRAGNHHSEAMKVTERYTRLGEDHLQYEARIEDPNTFTQPWTIRMPLYRRVEMGARLLEFKCVEFTEEMLYGAFKKKETE
jgi:hypothetical protein